LDGSAGLATYVASGTASLSPPAPLVSKVRLSSVVETRSGADSSMSSR